MTSSDIKLLVLPAPADWLLALLDRNINGTWNKIWDRAERRVSRARSIVIIFERRETLVEQFIFPVSLPSQQWKHSCKYEHFIAHRRSHVRHACSQPASGHFISFDSRGTLKPYFTPETILRPQTSTEFITPRFQDIPTQHDQYVYWHPIQWIRKLHTTYCTKFLQAQVHVES